MPDQEDRIRLWRALVALLAQQTLVLPSRMQGLFQALRSAFIAENETYLFVTASKGWSEVKAPPATAAIYELVDALNVHYASYNVNARIDDVTKLISVDAITDQLGLNRYLHLVDVSLTDCAKSIDTYLDQLGEPAQEIGVLESLLEIAEAPIAPAESDVHQAEGLLAQAQAAYAVTQTTASSPIAGQHPGLTGSPTVAGRKGKGKGSQAFLREAKEALRDSQEQFRRVREKVDADIRQMLSRPVTQLAILSAAEQRLGSDLRPDLKLALQPEGGAYQESLRRIAEARERLQELADTLRDQGTRKKIGDYAGPIFAAYEKGSARPLRRFAPGFWRFVSAALGGLVGSWGVALVWPYEGSPPWLLWFAGAMIGAAIGTTFPSGPTSRVTVKRAGEQFRKQLQSMLGRDFQQSDPPELDSLKILDTRVWIGTPPSPPPKKRWWNIFRPSPTGGPAARVVVRAPARDAGPVGASPAVRSIPTVSFPGAEGGEAKQSKGWRKAGISFTVAFGAGLIVTAGPYAASWASSVFGPRPQAQLIGTGGDQQACEIASGRLVWQDADQLVVEVAAQPPSPLSANKMGANSPSGGEPPITTVIVIPRAKLSTVVFRSPQPGVAPCSHAGESPGPVTVSNNLMTVSQADPTEVSTPTHILAVTNQIYVEGQLVRVVAPLERYVVVPLPLRVADMNYPYAREDPGRTKYFQGIYDLYQKHRDLVDASVEIIRTALASSLDAGCDVTIDVQGFASRREFVNENDLSNLYLAEGRRNAVLTVLGFGNLNASKFAWVPGEWGSTQMRGDKWRRGTLRLAPIAKPLAVHGAPVSIASRFASFEEMTDSLHQWYAEPAAADTQDETAAELGAQATPRPVAPVPTAEAAFREAIARSVVIGILQSDLAAECPLRAYDGTLVAQSGPKKPG